MEHEEEYYSSVDRHQKSHINIETRLTIIEDKVKQFNDFIAEIKQFMESMKDNYREFTKETQKANMIFIRWLIGILVTVFIFASAGQYQALRVIQKDIHSLEIIVLQKEIPCKKE